MTLLDIQQIKTRIIVIITVVIALLIGIFLFESFEQREEVIAFSERQTAGYAKALSQHAERSFAETERASRDVLHDMEILGGLKKLSPRQVYDVMKLQTDGAPQIGDMFIVDAKGMMFSNTNAFPPKQIDVSDRDYYKFYATTPDAGVTLGAPVKSRLVGRWRFNLMRPLAKAGEPFQGLLAVAFEVEYFKKFFDPATIGSSGKIMLIHTNGKPLVYEPYFKDAYSADFTKSKLFKEILPTHLDSATFHVETGIVDSSPHIVSYKRLERYPVIAVVSLNRDEILKKWKKEEAIEAFITLVLSLIVASMGWVVFLYINRLYLAQEQLQGQKNVLEIISKQEKTKTAILEKMTLNAPLKELLAMIVLFVEEQSPGALCSVLLVDNDKNVLRHGAAPSLPDKYNKAVDGLRIMNKMGSCGTAAFLKQRVVVEDIATHPFWKGFAPVFEAGLRSCWSEPIIDAMGDVLGTFAIYHKEPRVPSVEELLLIESAANLANIAIARTIDRERHQKLEEQLLHVQKIDSIGQLAGGIAHDLNNLLTPILVYGEMIKNKLDPNDPANKKVDGILLAANRAKDLNHKLLSFSRKQILCMELVDLNALISNFKEILFRTIPESIVLEIENKQEHAYIYGDKGQIEQVILNLVVNARDAITRDSFDNNGTIHITTSSFFITPEMATHNPGMTQGEQILLSVADSGCGMSQEIRQRIFEPFYTTKETGKGTGLGLSMVYGIVKQHNGYIALESNEGKGTVFMIYLPTAKDSVAITESSDLLTTSFDSLNGSKNAVILLVEDNEMIRNMTEELLQSNGFKVYCAELPSVALEIAKEHQEINLLVSDVVMPEMNGQELYAHLKFYLPDLPAIFMSGYTNNVMLHEGTPKEGYNFLHKPFTSKQMLDAIHLVFG